MPGELRLWPAVRQHIASLLADTGYYTVQTYFPDRGGTQVGRFNLNPKVVRYWLEYGAIIEEDRGEAQDPALGGEIPEPVSIEGEGTEESAEAGSKADEPIDPDDAVRAAHKWIDSVCSSNTPAGETGRFRLRVYRPKGEQLWSTILVYATDALPQTGPQLSMPSSGTEAASVAAFYAEKPSSPSHQPPRPPDDGLTFDERALTELLTMPGEDPTIPDIPGGYIHPDEVDDLDGLAEARTAEEAAAIVRAASTAARTPRGSNGQSIEVRTLFHLHGIMRAYESHRLSATREFEAIKTRGFLELMSQYSKLAQQQSQIIADARAREDRLVEAYQQYRLDEAEQAAEAAAKQDTVSGRVVLGKTALHEIGLLGRVLLTRPRVGGGKEEAAPMNGNGSSNAGLLTDAESIAEDLVEESEGTEEVEEVESRRNAPPELRIVPQNDVPPPPNAQAVDNVVEWLDKRPDVVEALADPNVQAYLRNAENVEQLRTLAQAMAAMKTALPSHDPADDLPDNVKD